MRQAYPVQRAHSRLSKFGPNLFRDPQERSLFLQFLSLFKTFKTRNLGFAGRLCK
ncbi:MAG: cation-transporting P-type ATPase [Methylococcaceae bacterium]